MKKKIVILSLTLGYGGIEKYISSLCRMFHEKFDIQIICNYKETKNPAFNFYNAKILYLNNKEFSNISIKKLLKNKNFLLVIKEILKRFLNRYKEKYCMIKQIKKFDCDYVITTRIKHNRLVNKYLKNKKIVKIATEHNFYDIEKNYDKKIVKSVSNFDYFILVSETLKNHYEKISKKAKCMYIPNVIDNNEKKLSKLETKNIISVGRFSPEKGFIDLIKVMKKVVKLDKEVRLFLIGDGYEKTKILNCIKEYKLENNVDVVGYKSYDEQKAFYLKSSLYVMTSLSESFGIVLLESMNNGVPCIAYDTANGAKTILSEVNFPLVSNRDINKMANLIVKLVNDKRELLKMRKIGKEYIKKFDISVVKNKWFSIVN